MKLAKRLLFIVLFMTFSSVNNVNANALLNLGLSLGGELLLQGLTKSNDDQAEKIIDYVPDDAKNFAVNDLAKKKHVLIKKYTQPEPKVKINNQGYIFPLQCDLQLPSKKTMKGITLFAYTANNAGLFSFRGYITLPYKSYLEAKENGELVKNSLAAFPNVFKPKALYAGIPEGTPAVAADAMRIIIAKENQLGDVIQFIDAKPFAEYIKKDNQQIRAYCYRVKKTEGNIVLHDTVAIMFVKVDAFKGSQFTGYYGIFIHDDFQKMDENELFAHYQPEGDEPPS